MSDILKQMQREQIELLQQRVKELEASLELRWADIAHLDTKLADVLDREWGLREALTEVVRLLGIGAPGAAYRDALAALSAHKEGGTNVPENEEGQCAEWPRCACGRGGPDLCAALAKHDSFFLENKERRPFGDKGLQREDQPPPLSPVATNLSAMDQEWE